MHINHRRVNAHASLHIQTPYFCWIGRNSFRKEGNRKLRHHNKLLMSSGKEWDEVVFQVVPFFTALDYIAWYLVSSPGVRKHLGAMYRTLPGDQS